MLHFVQFFTTFDARSGLLNGGMKVYTGHTSC